MCRSSQYQIWIIWALFNLKVIIFFLLGAENAVSIGKKSLKWMFQQPKTNVNKKINLELQRLFQNLSYFYKLLLKFLIPVVGFLLPTFDLQIQYFSPIKNFPVRSPAYVTTCDLHVGRTRLISCLRLQTKLVPSKIIYMACKSTSLF